MWWNVIWFSYVIFRLLLLRCEELVFIMFLFVGKLIELLILNSVRLI